MASAHICVAGGRCKPLAGYLSSASCMPQAPGLLLQHKAQGFPGHQLRVALMALVGEVRTCLPSGFSARLCGGRSWLTVGYDYRVAASVGRWWPWVMAQDWQGWPPLLPHTPVINRCQGLTLWGRGSLLLTGWGRPGFETQNFKIGNRKPFANSP